MTLRRVVAASELRTAVDHARRFGSSIGFVPTMGALHEGHAELVRHAIDECGVVVVSIFVNPTQFGAGEDFDAYPRPLDTDLALLSELGAHVVYTPAADEIYNDHAATRVRVGGLALVLEGERRPGHFDGVATVVSILLNTVGVCRVYFGEKDWQQLQVVKRMVSDLAIPVHVVGVPTARDRDGLALSSRNSHLTKKQCVVAPSLYKALLHGRELIDTGEIDPAVVEAAMSKALANESDLVVDYLVAVGAATLQPLDMLIGDIRLLGAVHLGKTRLIDNIGVHVAGE